MNEEQFEKWFNTANIPLHQHYSAKRTWQAAFAAGREEGLREALKCALAEGATPSEEGGNLSRWDSCDNVAAAIRALAEKKG